MRSKRLRIRTLPVLFAASLLAGCADGGNGGAAVAPPTAPSRDVQKRSLQKVAGSLPVFTVEQVVGPEGGALGVPGYTLTVPRGAVASPTRFTFASVNAGYVEVQLTATTVGSATPNDAGARGFAVPLLLGLSYDPSGGLPAWLGLVIAWDRPDGTLEEVPSFINPAQKVVYGRLTHFSQYVVAGN